VTADGRRPDRQELYGLLQGSGTPEVMAFLDDVRRTRNLLLLHGLRNIAESRQADAVQTARLRDSFTKLAAIESADRRPCARLVAHPHVGAWIATCLKRLKQMSDPRAQGARPLWADLGHLGAIAVAAALATRTEVEIAVPACDGMTFIPTVGRIRLGHASSWAMTTVRCGSDGTLSTAGGRQVIAAGGVLEQSRHHDALRRLTASSNGLTLSLELDDLGPYRDCHGLGASGRLTKEEVEEWRRRLTDGWAILTARHSSAAESISRGLRTLVPLSPHGLSGVSATSRNAPGAVALTRPRDGAGLACTLVHELQHAKLCLITALAPMDDIAKGELFYSPWRDDPRPLAGLVHGLYAGVAVTDFWRAEHEFGASAPVAAFQYARARRQVEKALDSLSAPDRHVGGALVSAIQDVATLSRDTAVSARCARLADDITLDHAVRWRLRNQTPAHGDIELLAASWRAGGPPTSPRAAVISPGSRESFTENARLRLAYAMLLAEGGTRTRAREPVSEPSSTERSDVSLLSGDYGAAATAYQHDIRAGIKPVDAWAGLAVALHGQHEPAAVPLSLRPELVLAVYEGLATDATQAPSPVGIARWMLPAMTRIGS
jgi:HEXXH motif-containing protein